MAALSITAANVRIESGNAVAVTYGETVTQGQPLRHDSATDEYMLCNNSTTTDVAATRISLTPGGDGELGLALGVGSKIDFGSAILTEGAPYYVGPNDGEIVPYADLASADKVTCIGHAETTAILLLTFDQTGATIA